MTAPDRTTWTVAEDADGDETLWYGDTAVLRRCDIPSIRLAGAQSYDVLWDVLTRVLAPDEATIERLADVLHHAAQPENEDPGPWITLPTWIKDILRGQAQAVLAALAGTSAQARHTAGDEAGGGT